MATEASAQATTMSLRAYGRRRKASGLPGGTAPAVMRAISAQRLKRSVVYVKGTAQIGDPDLADQEWVDNTDHSRAPSAVKAKGDGVTADRVTGRVTGQAAVTPPARSLSEASTREKNAKADLAELEFLEKSRQLVPAKAVEDAWMEIAAQVRTAILSVPSKAKTLMPHLTHEDLARLNDLLSQALETLADVSAADAA